MTDEQIAQLAQTFWKRGRPANEEYHFDIMCFARALLQAASAAPSLICKSCGADRFKEDCKGNRQTCPVRGEAQEATPTE